MPKYYHARSKAIVHKVKNPKLKTRPLGGFGKTMLINLICPRILRALTDPWLA